MTPIADVCLEANLQAMAIASWENEGGASKRSFSKKLSSQQKVIARGGTERIISYLIEGLDAPP